MRGKGAVLLYLLAATAASWGQESALDAARPQHAALAQCEGASCLAWSDSLAQSIEQILSPDGALDALPKDCAFMGHVASGDGRLHVFTWNWVHPDRTSGYGGLVAFRDQPGDPVRFTRLADASSQDRPNEQRGLKPEDWCGALYYAMVPDAVDHNTWLLLGWDDGDAQVTRKVVEPIEVRAKGVRFGAPILQTPNGLMRRYILEYADAVQASLRYQPASRGKAGHAQRIIFDHLAPREPHFTGITAYYGPDMTFDAFIPGKRQGAPWVLVEQADVYQDLPGDRPFNDPRQRNGGRDRR